jgi:hypothetical protein
MSRGPGEIERRIGKLFAATKDRALSVDEIAAYAFKLKGRAVPNRKQRLSATRAAHRVLRRAAETTEAVEDALQRVIAETAAKLGREPGGRGSDRHWFLVGSRVVTVDGAFAEAMKTVPSWSAWQEACPALDRERKRYGGVLTDPWRGGWRDNREGPPAVVSSRRLSGTRVGGRDPTGRRGMGRYRDRRN